MLVTLSLNATKEKNTVDIRNSKFEHGNVLIYILFNESLLNIVPMYFCFEMGFTHYLLKLVCINHFEFCNPLLFNHILTITQTCSEHAIHSFRLGNYKYLVLSESFNPDVKDEKWNI